MATFEELLTRSQARAPLKAALTEIAEFSAEKRLAMLEWFDEQMAAETKPAEWRRLLAARKTLSALDDKLNDHEEYRLRRPN
jgi:hypothetical protein